MGQRSLGSVKNGPGRQRNLVSALDALVAALAHQFICSGVPTSRANKSIRPPARCQILLAGFLRGEVALKLTKRLRERWASHPHTLPVGACWSNRI